MIEDMEKESEYLELHQILLEWFIDRDKKPKHIIAFLTSMWIGQMALNGYEEDFFDATLKHMKENWKTHRFNSVYKKDENVDK